jgi:CRP/FNR family transcriptional regulator
MLLAHPKDDGLFERIASHQVGLVDSDCRTMASARRALRRCYPAADLHRQTRVQIDGVPTTVWFAYRDGRLSATLPSHRWWSGRTVASAALQRSGQLTDTNLEFRTLVGLPPLATGQESVADNLGPDLCAEIRRIVRSLPAAGELRGALPIRLPWGKQRWVEFHAQWRSADGEYRVAARSLEDRDEAMTQAAASSGLAAASRAGRQRLMDLGTRKELEPGQGLGRRTEARWAIVVVAGIVRLFIHADGIEPTVAYAGHGALLGSHLVPGEDRIPIRLQALTPSVVMQLPAQSVEELMHAEAPFTEAVVGQTQALLGSTILTLAARTSADLPQRVAREVTLLGELHPSGSLIPVTEQQLADGVGSIRESVARVLGTFRRRGWIATTSHGLIVLQDDELREAGTAPPARLGAGSARYIVGN